MPWNKPYQPAANQRLDPAMYAQPGNIVFITIRAYEHQSPFVSPALNQMVVEALAEEAIVPLLSVVRGDDRAKQLFNSPNMISEFRGHGGCPLLPPALGVIDERHS